MINEMYYLVHGLSSGHRFEILLAGLPIRLKEIELNSILEPLCAASPSQQL